MKKYKLFICSLLLIISLSLLNITAYAIDNDNTTYLEAKDYNINFNDNEDDTQAIQTFLNTCQTQGKDAFFNSGTYILKSNLNLLNGVSILGDTNTIFRGVTDNDYQVSLLDSGSAPDIEIKNIVFDNVTIYCRNQGSINWLVERNVFINAKKADQSLDSGLAGEYTGYYILNKRGAFTIKSNLFLRDQNSKGRGIGLYYTNNNVIEDNYFGLLEDLDNSIVSDSVKALKTKVENLSTYDSTSNQGYFMTAINVISNDKNCVIKGNHFSLNKDIDEVGFETNSPEAYGYHRDHIIYAKEYDNLVVVGNYFKGQNKNQDGGVKIRNGKNVLVYRNIFEDVLLLFYVQTGSQMNYLTNTYAAQNIFINQDYTNKREELSNGSAKYPTQSFLILVHNYVAAADIDNLTIENNKIISARLNNETINIVRVSGDITPDNVFITNNTNYLGDEITITNEYSTNLAGTKFIWTNLESYQDINVNSLYSLAKANIKIANKKLISNDTIYLNNEEYKNQDLLLDTDYELLYVDSTNKEIIQLEGSDYEIPTNKYSIGSLNIKSSYNLSTKVKESINLADYINLSIYDTVSVVKHDGFTCEGLVLTPNIGGNQTVELNLGGFGVIININVETISDFTVNDISLDLNEQKEVILAYSSEYQVDFTYICNNNYLTITNNLVTPKMVGSHSVIVIENYSGIKKTMIVEVTNNKTIKINKTVLLGESFNLPDGLSSNKILEYDDTKLEVTNDVITPLKDENINLKVIDHNLIIEYEIIVINVSNINLALGDKTNINIYSNFKYLYDDNALTINEETGEVIAKSSGLHAVTIINLDTNEYYSFTINITID